MFYEAKFGRKRVSDLQDGHVSDQLNVSDGTSLAAISNGSATYVNKFDLAIYEQNRNQAFYFHNVVNFVLFYCLSLRLT